MKRISEWFSGVLWDKETSRFTITRRYRPVVCVFDRFDAHDLDRVLLEDE